MIALGSAGWPAEISCTNWLASNGPPRKRQTGDRRLGAASIVKPLIHNDFAAGTLHRPDCGIVGGRLNGGQHPGSDVVFDQAGNLYATTIAGGTYNAGTVYELSPSCGAWAESVLLRDTDDGVSENPRTEDDLESLAHVRFGEVSEAERRLLRAGAL